MYVYAKRNSLSSANLVELYKLNLKSLIIAL